MDCDFDCGNCYDQRDCDQLPEDNTVTEETKATGDGISVAINQYALQRIEAACIAGLRNHITNRINNNLNDIIREVAAARLEAVVGNLTETAVMEYLMKPRQPTNAWGEQIGGTPMTIADQIPQKVEKYLTELVDDNGRSSCSYGNNRLTRLDYMVRKIVITDLDVATKEAAKSVSDKAKQVVAAHVGRFVAEQMVPQIEVGKTSK